MSNEIVRAPEPVPPAAPVEVPVPKSFDTLRFLLERRDLPWSDRRKAARDWVRGYIDALNRDIKDALAAQAIEGDSRIDLVRKRVAAENHQLSTMIESAYLKFLICTTSEQEKLKRKFVMDFADEVTDSLEELRKRRALPAFKERIENMILASFDRLCDNLELLAKNMVPRPNT